jgi:hypothetical protein
MGEFVLKKTSYILKAWSLLDNTTSSDTDSKGCLQQSEGKLDSADNETTSNSDRFPSVQKRTCVGVN